MKTKIIYISGNEVFDMADIRAAFEEVRATLNLDKDTVLFGVPVDNDDAGLMKSDEPESMESDIVPQEVIEPVEPINDVIQDDIVAIDDEPVIAEPVKKRGRTRKTKQVTDNENTEPAKNDDKVVPILSVLSSKEEPDVAEPVDTENESEEKPEMTDADSGDIEIIEDIVQETEITAESDDTEIVDDNDAAEPVEESEDTEPDLEKLLSAMKPLQEDVLDATKHPDVQPDDNDDEDIDATLEQLATEFVQTQDKIASESKSSGRGRIGKLRNILPFKQSKHKDQGLGDLFGWAGVAANDEDFSVPGFFTKASSKE